MPYVLTYYYIINDNVDSMADQNDLNPSDQILHICLFQLDKHCYTRPCSESEICIPGSITGTSSGCSFSCMKAISKFLFLYYF